jgi:hypothetical protein
VILNPLHLILFYRDCDNRPFKPCKIQIMNPFRRINSPARSTIVVLASVISMAANNILADKVNSEADIHEPSPYSPYAGRNHPTRVYWGDTHLHTSNSGDAFAYGTRLDPESAYRFARGEEIEYTPGKGTKLSQPLDFLVIADHAVGLGIGAEIYSGNPKLITDPTIKRWHEMMQKGGQESARAAGELIRAHSSGTLPGLITDPKSAVPLLRSVWNSYIRLADRYNTPGQFTALIGYEWTSVPGGNNLHRVVVFRDDQNKTNQIIPFSAWVSEDPEKLWEFLSNYEQNTGGQVLAIPHNSNLSNGRMFAMVDFEGTSLDEAYVKQRIRWEPLVEITQIKGASETHPLLSPDDDFAGYGIAGWEEGNLTLQELKTTDMLQYETTREALKNGLLLESKLGTNPFRFGVLSSTDSHTALAAVEENNYFGKFTVEYPSPTRWQHVISRVDGAVRLGWQYLSDGLAAVWATENTREAIWDAMQRREVYGTTGPRITVRFFGGTDFNENDALPRQLVAAGYAKGVPMGGELSELAAGQAPSFLVAAMKDPESGNLDRIQIIKGWVDESGKTHEKIYDVAWSDTDHRQPNADGRLPVVGNTVDIATATWQNSIGDSELATMWVDPGFDSRQAAFYYVRVLEIPTPRWTAYDQMRFGVKMSAEVPMITIERAYTSPIWYTP